MIFTPTEILYILITIVAITYIFSSVIKFNSIITHFTLLFRGTIKNMASTINNNIIWFQK